MSDLKKYVLDLVEKIFDMIEGEEMSKKEIKNSLKEIKEILQELKSQEQEHQSITTQMFELLQNKYTEAIQETEMSKSKLQESKHHIYTLESDKKSLEASLFEEKKRIEDHEYRCLQKEDEIDSIRKKLESISLEMKDKERTIQALESYKETFASGKTMRLLEALLCNKTLEAYRRHYNITDKSTQSILHLTKQLLDAKTIINNYYKHLSEYKKEYQEAMSREEIDFYGQINAYFGETIIHIPENGKINSEFTKAEHRGINGETSGTIDDGIVLIPSDAVGNEKIKVKLKS